MNENTLTYLKKAIDDAIYIYGQCLTKDTEASGIAPGLEAWLEQSVEISNHLDTIL
jgi:hypothetical protein